MARQLLVHCPSLQDQAEMRNEKELYLQKEERTDGGAELTETSGAAGLRTDRTIMVDLRRRCLDPDLLSEARPTF